MKRTKSILTTVAFAGTLICGLLAANIAHADEHRWNGRARDEYRWDGRARVADRREIRHDYENLAAWRNKLQHDETHHASRKKLAEDENAIQQIEREIRSDRR